MKLFTIKINIIVLFLFMLTDTSCDGLFRDTDYVFQVPEQTNDGLEVGETWETGTDTTYLIKAVENIKKGKYNEVHSMLVYRNGKLMLEEYFHGHKFQWKDALPENGDSWSKTYKIGSGLDFGLSLGYSF